MNMQGIAFPQTATGMSALSTAVGALLYAVAHKDPTLAFIAVGQILNSLHIINKVEIVAAKVDRTAAKVETTASDVVNIRENPAQGGTPLSAQEQAERA